MMDYLPEATRITQSGGKIVINANGANPYFKSVPTQAQLDSLGLKIEYQGSLLPEYQNMQFLCPVQTSKVPVPIQALAIFSSGSL